MADDECALLPGDLAVWHGHVAMVVGKLLMGGFRRRLQVRILPGAPVQRLFLRIACNLRAIPAW